MQIWENISDIFDKIGGLCIPELTKYLCLGRKVVGHRNRGCSASRGPNPVKFEGVGNQKWPCGAYKAH